jgi:hypothetical protein
MKGIPASAVVLTWVGLLALGSAAPASAQAMKMAGESVPLPSGDEPRPLQKVFYGKSWKIEFTSIALRLDSEPGFDPVRALWTLTGRNTRPKPARAQLMVVLLDGGGKSLATAKKTFLIKSGGDAQPYTVEMKVPSASWARAERVSVQASFFVGS